MRKQLLTTIKASIISLAMVGTADAALVSRLGGQAYYDTDADLTWLAEGNYAKSSGYDDDGRMTWQEANDWVAQLTVGGVGGWRLPGTLQPDSSCDTQYSDGRSVGFNCTGSEMGNLYYNVLGNAAGTRTNKGPFSNIGGGQYHWSDTDWASNTDYAWAFYMTNGVQDINLKAGVSSYAWAVQSGDVSPVPVPAAIWLFGSALIGLVSVSSRKKI